MPVGSSLLVRAVRPLVSNFFYSPGPMVAASSVVSRSSYGAVLGRIFPFGLGIYIAWPACRVSVKYLPSAFGMGFPSGSMVIPFPIPFSDARTPVANSPG